MPRYEDISWEGLRFSPEQFGGLMEVGRDAGTEEAQAHEQLFDRFYGRLPNEFIFERELLMSRLWRSPEVWELGRRRYRRIRRSRRCATRSHLSAGTSF